MQLDYSILTQPVTKADIDAFKAATSKPQPKATKIVLFAVLGFIALSFVMITIISSLSFNTSNFTAPSPVILVAIPLIILAAFAARAQQKKRAKLYKFAIANRIQFLCDVANPGYSGMIFDEGDSRSISEALLFNDGTEIGNYQYSTGSGKNRQTHHWHYVRIKLSRRLPNMVLDARKNNLFGSLTNLPDSFSRNQTLSLEGDFNNYFTLYAPKEYERDALYIFTPDVMAAVIDAGQAYDMEVVDDNLMLYSSGKLALDSEVQLSKILGITTKVGSELRDQTNYYADERVGDRSVNLVAEPGRRLKSGVNIGAIVVFVLMIAYFLFSAFAY